MPVHQITIMRGHHALAVVHMRIIECCVERDASKRYRDCVPVLWFGRALGHHEIQSDFRVMLLRRCRVRALRAP